MCVCVFMCVHARRLVVFSLARMFRRARTGPHCRRGARAVAERTGVAFLGRSTGDPGRACLQRLWVIAVFLNVAATFSRGKEPPCLKGVLKAGLCSCASVLLPKIILQDAGKGIVHFLRVFNSHSPKNNTETVNTCTFQRFLANNREINGLHSGRTSLTSSVKSGRSGNCLLIQILIIPAFWPSPPPLCSPPMPPSELNYSFQGFDKILSRLFPTKSF